MKKESRSSKPVVQGDPDSSTNAAYVQVQPTNILIRSLRTELFVILKGRIFDVELYILKENICGIEYLKVSSVVKGLPRPIEALFCVP